MVASQKAVRRVNSKTWHKTWLLSSTMMVFALGGGLANAEEAVNWDQWRGPQRTGATELVAKPWPQKLNGSLVKTWNAPLEPSYSGPILRGDLVYTTETVDKKFERVSAFNRQTGELVWKQDWEGAMKVPFFAAANGSWIRATPAVDEELIYVGGIRDHLVALNRLTGEFVWQKDCVSEFSTPVPTFGFVSSPIVDGDDLYVQAAGSVLKLNKKDGKVIWRAMSDGGGMNGSAFSSPVILELNNTRQLVVQTRKKLTGINLQDGSVLWARDVPAFRGMNILTPTMWNQRLFTSAYGGKSFLFQLTQSQDVEVEWENKSQAYMSSPIIIADHAYVQLRNRRFTCIDLKSGKSTWTTRPFKAQYWSMISQGDRILALDDLGNLRLIRANPAEYDLIDEIKVSEESTWAHLANDGQQLFVRDLRGLTAFKLTTNLSSREAAPSEGAGPALVGR